MAGALGIEPRSTVLETDVEPFNYTPKYCIDYFNNIYNIFQAFYLNSLFKKFP